MNRANIRELAAILFFTGCLFLCIIYSLFPYSISRTNFGNICSSMKKRKSRAKRAFETKSTADLKGIAKRRRIVLKKSSFKNSEIKVLASYVVDPIGCLQK
jgi:hypothetical protein